jgi:hypothetical protein
VQEQWKYVLILYSSGRARIFLIGLAHGGTSAGSSMMGRSSFRLILVWYRRRAGSRRRTRMMAAATEKKLANFP